ncbi:hypothetical protein [Methylocystis sp. ATCC 49242]|jgi:hypothetical protein|uniref:hypothetical protein n=1 Tax=Methylocystis sp. ATCC 49242 TaxID=622637 RepID=UPI0011861789|nr:hypothetical protein [Methylocystis sp. ATCC 49242]
MSKEEREELLDILRALDGAHGDFDNDHSVIYPSDADRLRLFHTAEKRWAKRWSRPSPCMHEGCTEPSIPRSHSISLSASMKLIAEHGHVVTPKLGKTGIEMERIGIRDASTFPGFCARHEAQFMEFETKKEMSSNRHYLLQTFRTLCREIFRMRHQKEKLESALNGYRELRREFVATRIRQVHHSKPLEVRDIRFENDEYEDSAVEAIDSISEDLPILERLYRDLFDDIENATTESSLFVISFDLRLPVCLSGLGILNYVEGSKTMRALCLLAIVPEERQTKIIVGAAKEHANALASYCSNGTSPALLAMMESWLCHGSDHWFMTPSEWHAIPESRQKAILGRISDPHPSIADPVEFSIFDSVRSKIIDSIEQALSNGEVPTDKLVEVHDLLASEKKKLHNLTST